MNEEQMVCFAWCFIRRPKLVNYSYCETVQECRRDIERRYGCTSDDYQILKKQIRIVKQKDNMKYYSEILAEEDVPEERKERYADKKGQRHCRSKQQDTTHQGRPPAKQLVLLLVE